MARRKQKPSSGAAQQTGDMRTANAFMVADAFGEPITQGAAAAVTKGAELLGSGAGALGGLARAGLRAASSVNVDAVADAAREVLSSAGDMVGPAAGMVAGAAGEALSAAGGLAGPALEVTGEVAGAVLGAVVEIAGDALSS